MDQSFTALLKLYLTFVESDHFIDVVAQDVLTRFD
jgi:hypothetical protein